MTQYTLTQDQIAAVLFNRIQLGEKLTQKQQDELLEYIMDTDTQEVEEEEEKHTQNPFDSSDRMYDNEVIK